MAMGGGGSQSQTTQNKPWAGAVPDMQQYLSDLSILANPFGGQMLPAQSVAMFSPLQRQALGMFGGEAGQASRLGGQAAGTAGDILAGKYLNPSTNQYLPAYFNAAAAPMVNQYQMATAPMHTAQDVMQGALGGSGQNQQQQYDKWSLGNNLQSLAANIYEPAYAAGLNQMTSTLGMTPGLESAAFTPAQGLFQGGSAQQAQQQNILDTAYRNALAQYNLPYNKLSMLGEGAAQMGGQGGVQIGTQHGLGGFK